MYITFKKELTIIRILSLAGIIISTYLAVTALGGVGIDYCLTGSECDVVNNSAYSRIFEIPVSVVGILGYALILTSSFLSTSKQRKWYSLFILTTVGVAFSLYLTYMEIFQINAICGLCIVSLIIMLSIFTAILFNKGKMAPSVSSLNLLTLAIVLSASVVLGANIVQSSAGPQSSSLQVSLAKHLSSVNAVMYGAYNCSHCTDQKNDFGTRAFKHIKYVECNKQGKNANPSLCFAKGIQGYPTWEIGGKFYKGRQSLKKLSEVSNFNYRKDL